LTLTLQFFVSFWVAVPPCHAAWVKGDPDELVIVKVKVVLTQLGGGGASVSAEQIIFPVASKPVTNWFVGHDWPSSPTIPGIPCGPWGPAGPTAPIVRSHTSIWLVPFPVETVNR